MDILINVTPRASEEVKKFLQLEQLDPTVGGLRLTVKPGGCSGFQYELVIADAAVDDDLIIQKDGWQIFVDPFSAPYLNGITLDYASTMQASGFLFNNPNATGGCGCGTSFSA